jgi:hypothetical protein
LPAFLRMSLFHFCQLIFSDRVCSLF